MQIPFINDLYLKVFNAYRGVYERYVAPYQKFWVPVGGAIIAGAVYLFGETGPEVNAVIFVLTLLGIRQVPNVKYE